MANARPHNINDLQVMWAIRDIPSEILEFRHKAILWGFLSIIGNNEYCYYSLPELADIFGTSVKTIQRSVQFLEKTFLRVVRSKDKGRTNRNQYYLEYDLILFCGNKDNLTLLKNKQVNLTLFKQEIRSICPENKVNLTWYKKDIREPIKKEKGFFTEKNKANLTCSSNDQNIVIQKVTSEGSKTLKAIHEILPRRPKSIHELKKDSTDGSKKEN